MLTSSASSISTFLIMQLATYGLMFSSSGSTVIVLSDSCAFVFWYSFL